MEREYGILLYSSKSKGERIAYYDQVETSKDYSKFIEYQDILKEKFPKIISFPLHFICIEDIQVLHLKDPFFKNIKLISNFEQFKKEIKEDIVINNNDLVKLALKYRSYTNLYLFNIMYFIDSAYTRKYREKFIEENFAVYPHGPVLESFYNNHKNRNKKPWPKLTREQSLLLYSRMLQLEGGKEAYIISKEVFDYYGKLNDSKLYDQGHHSQSAWNYLAEKHGDDSKVLIKKEDILEHEQSLYI